MMVLIMIAMVKLIATTLIAPVLHVITAIRLPVSANGTPQPKSAMMALIMIVTGWLIALILIAHPATIAIPVLPIPVSTASVFTHQLAAPTVRSVSAVLARISAMVPSLHAAARPV
jgi:hypothetical protein